MRLMIARPDLRRHPAIQDVQYRKKYKLPDAKDVDVEVDNVLVMGQVSLPRDIPFRISAVPEPAARFCRRFDL